jgi:lipoic acid synthetase
MRDLHDAGCELLTITQYLRPSVRHHPVQRWVTPEEFAELREEALEIGFAGVMSGPLMRSSYSTGRLYREAMNRRRAATSAMHSIARAPVPLWRVSHTRLHSERPGS